MKEKTGHFEGARGLQLFYRTWLPDKSPQAVLVIIHGVGEHIGRYKNLVDGLVPSGFILTGYDQRGHGQSEGQRGHIQSWSDFREDIGRFLKLAFKLAPGLPVFLYGHSQGSLEVLDYILRDSKGLAGAIISGAAIEPKGSVAPPHLILIAKVLSKIAPTFPLKVKLDGSTLSRNPQVAKAYMEDPLVHWQRSVSWGAESLKTVEWVKSRARDINLPILFVHGESDPLLDAAGAQRYYDQIHYPDKTIHIYPGGLHEPHNDICSRQVIADMKSWMEKRSKPGKKRG
jgi:alpha-beta hydrolase superfamily lysophospholipase